MRKLFEIQLLNFIVRSEAIFEHIIVTNSANNAVDITTHSNSLCLISHEWYPSHGIVKIN